MRMTDGRKRDTAGQEALRRLGIAMLHEGGVSQREVARRLAVRPQTVCTWVKQYRREGEEGLVAKPKTGRPPKLNARQRQQLFRIVTTKNPRQLQFPFALWTVPLVAEVIERKFGLTLHPDNVRKMLRAFGLTPQVPTARAYARSEEACERWAAEDFPAIAAEVRRKQAVLLFLDESGVQESDVFGRTWAPKGQRPTVLTTGGRDRVNVISAVSPSGRLWFRCYRGTLRAERFVGFLRDLLHDIRGPIVIVWDRLRVHTAKLTQEFLADGIGRRLSPHLLPAYAPELNPDEHVWSMLKRTLGRAPHIPGQDLADRVETAMDDLAGDRAKVRSVFHAPTTKYVVEGRQ